jgi:hypothetical protein
MEMTMRNRTLATVTFALLSAFCVTPALADAMQFSEDFETSTAPKGWFVTGGAGFDWNKGLARAGQGNAWVRYDRQGTWNAVNRWVTLSAAPAGARCHVNAFLRVSPNVTDGYISVRPGYDGQTPGDVIKEIKISEPTPPANNGYKEFTFDFAKPNSDIIFYVGLWGNGRDGWIQVDDVAISCTW